MILFVIAVALFLNKMRVIESRLFGSAWNQLLAETVCGNTSHSFFVALVKYALKQEEKTKQKRNIIYTSKYTGIALGLGTPLNLENIS